MKGGKKTVAEFLALLDGTKEEEEEEEEEKDEAFQFADKVCICPEKAMFALFFLFSNRHFEDSEKKPLLPSGGPPPSPFLLGGETIFAVFPHATT